MTELKIKRIYQSVDPDDGFRVLIDGLWPRGMRKDEAHIDLWLKEVAPSPQLRQWFQHDPEKWLKFCQRYHRELDLKRDYLRPVLDSLKVKNVTLLYGSREEKINNANALRDYILSVYNHE